LIERDVKMKRTQKLDEIFKDAKFTSFEEVSTYNDLLDLELIPSKFIEGQILSSTGQGQLYIFRVEGQYYEIDLGSEDEEGNYGITSFEDDLDEEMWSNFIEDFYNEESMYFYEGGFIDPSIQLN
jgi:hypothetical protein